MRRVLFGTTAGLLLVPLAGMIQGSQLARSPAAGPVKAPPAPVKPVPKDKGETCGSFGTSVEFVETPSEAARLAKKEQKLVFVLHVSGNFEDPRFT
jgi:hypothetical protein